MTLTISIVIL